MAASEAIRQLTSAITAAAEANGQRIERLAELLKENREIIRRLEDATREAGRDRHAILAAVEKAPAEVRLLILAEFRNHEDREGAATKAAIAEVSHPRPSGEHPVASRAFFPHFSAREWVTIVVAVTVAAIIGFLTHSLTVDYRRSDGGARSVHSTP